MPNTIMPESSPEKEHAGRRVNRRVMVPRSSQQQASKLVWVLTDQIGWKYLKTLTHTDVASKASHLYNHYIVDVQETARDKFEYMLSELEAKLREEEHLPVAVVVHCGAAYFGNPNYNRAEIEAVIVMKMMEAEALLHSSDRFCQGHYPKLIWSWTIAEPIKSAFFTPAAIYNCLKTVNSEAAASLFKKQFGIIKHSVIEPSNNMFLDKGGAHFQGKNSVPARLE